MTQMLLFDSNADTIESPAPAVACRLDDSRREGEVAEQPANVAAVLEHDSGLHHMGDLARLVLMRYDLMARRRAAMANRKAAQEARSRF